MLTPTRQQPKYLEYSGRAFLLRVIWPLLEQLGPADCAEARLRLQELSWTIANHEEGLCGKEGGGET